MRKYMHFYGREIFSILCWISEKNQKENKQSKLEDNFFLLAFAEVPSLAT